MHRNDHDSTGDTGDTVDTVTAALHVVGSTMPGGLAADGGWRAPGSGGTTPLLSLPTHTQNKTNETSRKTARYLVVAGSLDEAFVERKPKPGRKPGEEEKERGIGAPSETRSRYRGVRGARDRQPAPRSTETQDPRPTESPATPAAGRPRTSPWPRAAYESPLAACLRSLFPCSPPPLWC